MRTHLQASIFSVFSHGIKRSIYGIRSSTHDLFANPLKKIDFCWGSELSQGFIEDFGRLRVQDVQCWTVHGGVCALEHTVYKTMFRDHFVFQNGNGFIACAHGCLCCLGLDGREQQRPPLTLDHGNEIQRIDDVQTSSGDPESVYRHVSMPLSELRCY